jgi:hypothetical protein
MYACFSDAAIEFWYLNISDPYDTRECYGNPEKKYTYVYVNMSKNMLRSRIKTMGSYK